MAESFFHQSDSATVSNCTRKRTLREVQREDLQISCFSKHLLIAISDTMKNKKGGGKVIHYIKN